VSAYCPRCGAPREKGAKFCAACGAPLDRNGQPPRSSRSPRGLLGDLVGSTRKARLVSACTAVAVLIALVAFIAIPPAKEAAIPHDSYTIAADQICLQAKKQIVASERRSLRRSAGKSNFAQELVPIVTRWRTEFDSLAVPSDRIALAQALDTDLREVAIEIATLARVIGEGDRKATLEKARQVDGRTSAVERAVSALGLARCARLVIGASPPSTG
jgi:zinc ribbon protein